MLLSKLLGERFKEKPADASLASHIFLLRGGYVRQVANGIYSMLLPARRIAAKIEAVIREEMDDIGGQEVLFPVVLPLSYGGSPAATTVSEASLSDSRTGPAMICCWA